MTLKQFNPSVKAKLGWKNHPIIEAEFAVSPAETVVSGDVTDWRSLLRATIVATQNTCSQGVWFD